MANGVQISQSLKTRLTLAMLAVFLASIWSLSFLATQLLRRDFQAVIGEQQGSTISALAAIVNRGLAARLEALEKIAGASAGVFERGPAAMEGFLANRPALNDFFNGGVRAYGSNLEIVGRTEGKDIAQHLSEAEGLTAAETIRTGRRMVGKATLCSHCGGARFDLAAPIRDVRGRVVGALVGSIDLGLPGFLDPIQQARFGETGSYLMLSPRDRFVLLSSDPSIKAGSLAANDISPKLDRLLAGDAGPDLEVGQSGEEELISARAVPAANWVLAAVLPASEAFKPIHALQRQIVFATLFFSAVVAALCWWILRAQLAPLLRAAKTLRLAAGSGEAIPELPVFRPDEVGAMATAFNGLLRGVRERQNALQASERRFRDMLQHIPSVAVQGYGPDTITLYWNEASERLYGYTAEEAIGRSLVELIIPPETRDGVLADMRTMFETGRPIAPGELSLMRKDGSRVPVYSSHAHVHVPGREPEMFCLDIDLTARKRMEDRLRQREESLQAVIDNFPFIVWLKDCDSRFMAVNQAFARAFGWPSAPSLIGHNDFDITSPDLAEGYRSDDRAVLAAGKSRQLEELIEVGGKQRWFETYKSPVLADGRLIGTVGFSRDFSDRKAAEMALRDSEKRLEAILEQLPLGVGLLDRQGTFSLSNSLMRQITAEKMASRDPQTVPRWSALDAAGNPVPPTDWPGARALRGETVSPGMEFTYRSDGCGERIILVSAVPFRAGDAQIAGAIVVAQDISERKQAEEKVHQSEALLQALLNGNPDPIFLKDREGRLLLANPATFAVIGKPAEDCIGKTDEQYYENSADGCAIMANDQRIMASGKTETVEEQVTTLSGARYYVSRKAPYRNAAGKIVGVIGTARDITERKLAEKTLRESEARFRATFEQAAVGIVHIAPDGRWLRVNRKLCNILGYGYEELMGSTFDVMPLWDGLADDGPQIARLLARELDGFTVEKQLERKGGERIWIAVTAALVWREDGAPDYFVAVVEDISARRAAEAALQHANDTLEQRVMERTAEAEARARDLYESERFARATVDALSAHLCVLDEQGNILATNRAWEQFARENGARMPSVSTGANYFAVCDAAARGKRSGNTAALAVNGIRDMLAGRRDAFSLEYDCHSPDQQRWFVATASRFAGPGPVRLLLLHENVSAQRRAAQEMEASAREMARLTAHIASVREEEGRRIAGEVHDELGGTLTVLKLGLAMLKETPPDPDALPPRVDAIIGQADAAIQSVRRIAASLRPPMLDALGLSATIRWQGGEFSRQTGIATVVQVPEAIDLPQERSIAVYRIIQEALTNVARHASATQVQISIQTKDHSLTLEILDNGRGFDSTKERRKRSFGLVGMRERAQYLGGEMEITCAPGEGTAVRLRIPLDLEAPAP